MPVAFQTILISHAILKLAVRALPATFTLALLTFTVAIATFAATTQVSAVTRRAKVALLTHARAFNAFAMHTFRSTGLDIACITHIAHLAQALAISAVAIAGAIVRTCLTLTEVSSVSIVALALFVLAAATTVAILVAGVCQAACLSSGVRVPASTARARLGANFSITAHTVNYANE